LLLLTALSGIAVHIFRYLDFPLTTHFTYAVHLAIAVPMLIVELPFGKLSHVMYRPLAIYFEAVRERAVAEEGSLGESINKETVAA
jgi:heterodisulfide reductase subunit C/quinone-modifying oxidoreductase subunit QmoC